MFCQKCGAENKDEAAFCNSCGTDLHITQIISADPSMTGSCESCETPVKPGEKLCSRCLAIKLEGMTYTSEITSSTLKTSKNNKIITAKIATKKEQIAGISQVGPVLLCLLGFPALLLYIIPGLILIGIAIWWSSSRENEKKKLQNEIKELELELE